VPVVVLENPDRFAIRLTTEDEHEDDSKFRNLGLIFGICGYFEDGTPKRLASHPAALPCYTSPRLGALAVRD
jgi:hypothetical protein